MSALQEWRATTSDGTLPFHAWPGGYPIAYFAEDGTMFCPECANQEDADPDIAYADILWEGPASYCDGCGTEMETAYGDPDAEDGDE